MILGVVMGNIIWNELFTTKPKSRTGFESFNVRFIFIVLSPDFISYYLLYYDTFFDIFAVVFFVADLFSERDHKHRTDFGGVPPRSVVSREQYVLKEFSRRPSVRNESSIPLDLMDGRGQVERKKKKPIFKSYGSPP